MIKKFLALFAAMTLLVSCGANEADEPVSGDDIPLDGQQQEKEKEEIKEPENITVTFTAVGDNLLHNTLSIDSRTENGHDFYHIYEGIADEINGSDIAFVNQEVPLDGTEGAYPTLSAPYEAADALIKVGFNVASLANNHMGDKGVKGFLSTVETMRNAGFEGIVGGFDTKEMAETPVIIEKNGVKIGFLAYTYGLNSGLGDDNWMVNRISTDKITADVNAIRPLCDFLAVSMHWGVEYEHEPSDSQREFARLLADLDVDLVIGSHPHVLQPAQWLDRPGKEQTLCIYSLGNFASGQREQDRLLGGMLKLELEFTPEGEFIGYKSADVEGIVTHYDYGNTNFRLYMIDDYNEELAASHGLHKYDLPVSYAFFTERMAGIKESIAR